MEIFVIILFAGALISFLIKAGRPSRRITLKPKYKQYSEDRNTDYFMKSISKAYNIQEEDDDEEEEEEDGEREEEYNDNESESDIDFEEKSASTDPWKNQEPTYNTYEIEDIETRSKFFKNNSMTIEIICILYIYGLNVMETNFPNIESFLLSHALISLFVKTAPIFLLMFILVLKILGSRDKPLGGRISMVIRQGLTLLLSLGYVISQLSDFVSNSK